MTAADPSVLSQLVAYDRKVGELEQSLEAGRRKISDLDALEAEVAAAHEAAKARLTDTRLSVRRTEAEIADLKRQAALHKGHLSDISDTREWRALNEEIRYIQRQIEEREEATLASMEQAEKAQAVVGEAAAALETKRAEVAVLKSQLVAERERQAQELERARALRDQFVRGMPPVTLRFYERLAARQPMPIVWLWESACSFCHHRLTPQSQIAVKRGQSIVTCESCGRIVVAPPANGAPRDTAQGPQGVAGGAPEAA